MKLTWWAGVKSEECGHAHSNGGAAWPHPPALPAVAAEDETLCCLGGQLRALGMGEADTPGEENENEQAATFQDLVAGGIDDLACQGQILEPERCVGVRTRRRLVPSSAGRLREIELDWEAKVRGQESEACMNALHRMNTTGISAIDASPSAYRLKKELHADRVRRQEGRCRVGCLRPC